MYSKSLLAIFIISLASCNRTPKGEKPQVKPLIEAVYASGFVVAKDQYEIFTQVEGTLADKLVHDGDLVRKGDPLFVLESGMQSARYNIAKETFDVAQQNSGSDSPILRELRAVVAAAKSKVQFDSMNDVRYSNLWKEKATSKADFDRIKLLYENSRNEYALQTSRLERVRNQVDLDWQHAKNQLVIASMESGRYIVRSETDGAVLLTLKEAGELVRRNEMIAVVGKKNSFYLQLSVDELDIHRVKAGQGVLVKIDAYPDQIFNGTITKVYPMVDRRLQTVRADAELKNPLPGGFTGLALEANIIIHQKERALVIPKNRLLYGDSVVVHSADGLKTIKVKKGIETFDEVEITEGIDTSVFLVNNQ
jgi:HlyD family secretion protein